jgi:membrane-associated phospholipid phosphatase
MNDLDSRTTPVAPSSSNSTTRRQFLARIPGGAGAALASSAVSFGSSAEEHQHPSGGTLGTGADRVLDSYQLRVDAARAEASIPVPKQMTNGDEHNYRNFIGNFHKGLPHNDIGEVIPNDYRDLLNALGEGTAAALEKKVRLAGSTKLVNCLAGLAFDVEGTDSHQLKIPPFPKLASQDLADQAVELYWMALCRDVNFTKYETDPTAQYAATELSSLKEFKGPRSKGGSVTAQTLFRGFTADDLIGPYVSQFLLKPFSYGPYAMNGLMTVAAAGADYLITRNDWLDSQNGKTPVKAADPDPTPRAIRNGRDLATYVHTDPNAGLFMSSYNAGIFLFENDAPLNPGNPYRAVGLGGYAKQSPFGTFGMPFFLGLIGEAATRAFKAAWYAKWFVHRALRPDQYGGLVHWTKRKEGGYPVHFDILNSAGLANVFAANKGTYFLPQAYPEAGPQHPAYPSGHATMAGACATILKAAFDGDATFAKLADNTVVVASDDGRSRVPVVDPGLTIGGEIVKLASNIAFGRNFAGIHWRSDAEWGMRLGEAVAISLLQDQSNNYAGENFDGFTITKFDGTTVTV